MSGNLLCSRSHVNNHKTHLEYLCPENYRNLCDIPTCSVCHKLLEIVDGCCKRTNLNNIYNNLNHDYTFCPEMGNYYCKCVCVSKEKCDVFGYDMDDNGNLMAK